MSRVATISAQLVLDAQRFDRTIRNVKKQFKKLATDSRAQMAAVGAVLGAVAVGAGKLSIELENAGDEVVKLRQVLSSSFTGDELDSLTKKIRELGATPPYSAEQFTKAAKQLKSFEKDVEANLTRIGNIAVKSGGEFNSLAESFATFGIKAEASNRLLEVANISPAKLAEYGAVLDATGKALDFTGANAAKAQRALEKLADTEFAGAMDAVVTETEALRGELDLLTQELGTGLSEMSDSVAGVLLPFAEGLRDMSDETKKLIGLGIGLTGFVAALGAAAIGVGLIVTQVAASVTAAGGFAVVMGTVTAALGTAATAASGFVLALAPIVATAGAVALAVGGLTYAVYQVNEALDEYVRYNDEALAIELRRARAGRELNDVLGKSVDELREQGTTAEELAYSIGALQQRIEIASEAGNDALVDRIKEQVIQLQAAKRELAVLEREDRNREADAAEASKPKTSEQLKAAEEARKKSLKAELDAIELRLAKEEITQKQALELRAQALQEFKAGEEEKRALIIETARFETEQLKKSEDAAVTEAEKARAARLQGALDYIEQEKLANRLSAEEELKALDRIVKGYETTESEKRSLVRRTAQVRKQIRDQDLADAESKAAKKKAIAEKLADDLGKQAKADQSQLEGLQDRARSQQVQQVDTKIQRLGDEEGVDNTAKIQGALKERLRLEVESLRIQAERAKAETKNADVIAQIEENLQRDIRSKIQRTAEEERTVLQEQLEARQKLAEDSKKLDGPTFGDVFGIEELGSRLSDELNTTARGSQPDDLEIPVPDIEAIEQRLQMEITKVTAEAPALVAAIGQLSSAVAARPSNSAAIAARPSSQAAPSQSISPSAGTSNRVSGSIDINVTVDSKGKPTVETTSSTGLDGRFSEITRNSRGMRGRLTFA